MARHKGFARMVMRWCGLETSWKRFRLVIVAWIAIFLPFTAMHRGATPAITAPAPSNNSMDAILGRAEAAKGLLGDLADYYTSEVAPLERVLLDYRKDKVLARRIATALVREANRANVQPRLLLAVLLVENPMLDPSARSPVGAQGLMQVMPLHRGKWSKCPASPDGIEANICYGAQIFAYNFKQERGNVERALLRYNGCVRGTNTPGCQAYPTHVYASVGRASLRTWLRPELKQE